MATDIGDILFSQLLNMQMYPGSPFTGNIYRDLIMFLVVPTIFIIMVLYIMTGRIIPDKKMRIMIGVGAYLFIIASGFYPVFALLAGPYFIFLIFILGLLGFLASHFKVGGGPRFSGGGGPTASFPEGKHGHAKGLTNSSRIRYLEEEISKIEKELPKAQDKRAEYLQRKLDEMRDELYYLRHPMERN